jgi:hypothetical protein
MDAGAISSQQQQEETVLVFLEPLMSPGGATKTRLRVMSECEVDCRVAVPSALPALLEHEPTLNRSE